MNDRFKFRAVLKTDRFSILVEPFYILEDCYFIDINKAEVEFECKYPEVCFWDFIDEIKKQDYIQEIASDADLIITKDFTNLIQCTGLKDKNGNLIYEGDIVESKHKPDREGWYCVWRGVVQYDNQNCQYVLKASHYSVLNETKLNKATFENNESFNWFDWLEVIGNIYQDKELLNE